MRIINLNSVSSTIGMPVKSGTLQHIQTAYKEAIAALANLMTNQYISLDSTDFFILYGCVNSGSGSSYNISAGAIYFNGEIYLVPAVSFTAAGGEVAVGAITTTQYTTNADPVTFTDGNSRNIHDIRTINFASGASGSGDVDFSALQPNMLILANSFPGALPSSLTVTFTKNIFQDFSSAPSDCTITFDFTGAIPGTVVKLRWAYSSGRVLTVTPGSGTVADFESGSLTSTGSLFAFYCMYNGKDHSGNNLVSYHVIQM